MENEDLRPRVYKISELTSEIADLLEGRFSFVWVEGEISNFSAPVSGHYYMVLKDEKAQIRAVMFRPQARYLKFVPENGMKAIAQGRLGVYSPRGEYQLVLDYIEPMGTGALAVAFEQLKAKLTSEGLFDVRNKKPLPFLPQRVAVVTSPTGAAIRDFLKILHRRFANIEITIIPVRVQGEEAVGDLVGALGLANQLLDMDVVVITRGGGSLEDLWPFNQEELARAIRASRIPVVSAVGHEVDVTICDLAADFRAPTPSAAGELLVDEKQNLLGRIREIKGRLIQGSFQMSRRHARDLHGLRKRLRDPRRQLDAFWLRLSQGHGSLVRLILRLLREARTALDREGRGLLLWSPVKTIPTRRLALDHFSGALLSFMDRRLREERGALDIFGSRISDLSPLSILRRGYSIARTLPDRAVLKEASTVQMGDRIELTLARGRLACAVTAVDPDPESGRQPGSVPTKLFPV